MLLRDRYRIYPDIISQFKFILVFNIIIYKLEYDIPTCFDYVEVSQAFLESLQQYIHFQQICQNEAAKWCQKEKKKMEKED
ncbi:unnamed protein product [Paramecium pentaurelia]|uniref:Uncharacterized protein n=1 Tax=Paramecium pentaurelia TaxID=43138 RepID=A0A8S1T0F6_9CILI|nr:unnamed protein product [Paramecium pentaurelia]